MRCKSRLVAAITRTSTSFDRDAPTGRISCPCRNRSSANWKFMLDVADLVQEHRAPVGGLEHAHAVAVRSGERAAHGAEQLAFQQRGRDRPAIHRHERLRRRAG